MLKELKFKGIWIILNLNINLMNNLGGYHGY